MRIDVHNHAIPKQALAVLAADPVYRVTIDGDRWRGGNYADFTIGAAFTDPWAKLDELDRWGIDAAVISAAPKPLFYYELGGGPGERICRATNEGLADFCASAPQRLRWMAHIPLQEPKRAIAVLDEARRGGAAGVLVGTSIAGRRLDEPAYEPVWTAIEDTGLPVLLHPGYEHATPGLERWYLASTIGLPLEVTIATERLICAGTLDRHPHVKIIVTLGGGFFPYQAGRLRQARKFRSELAQAPSDPWKYVGQLIFDTNLHDPMSLRFLIDAAGPEHVVFGTDLPFGTAAPDPLGLLSGAVDGDRTLVTQIAEYNPADLFNFEAART